MKYVEVPKLLRMTLKEKGMTDTQFAKRMGRSKKVISETLNGVASISPEFAIHCERVLGILASYLTSLQMYEQLEEARRRVDVSRLPPSWSYRRSRKKPGPKPRSKKKSKSPSIEPRVGEFGVGVLDAREREHKSWERTAIP